MTGGDTMRVYMAEKRKESNKSQQQVANILGISRQYYSAIEKGERQKKISVDLLCRIADAINVPVDELITEERKYSERA